MDILWDADQLAGSVGQDTDHLVNAQATGHRFHSQVGAGQAKVVNGGEVRFVIQGETQTRAARTMSLLAVEFLTNVPPKSVSKE